MPTPSTDVIQAPSIRLQYNAPVNLLNPINVTDLVAATQGIQTMLTALAGFDLTTDFGIVGGFAYAAGTPGTYGPGWFYLNGNWYYQPTPFNENQSLVPNITLAQSNASFSDTVARNTYQTNFSQVGSGAIKTVAIDAGGTGYAVGDVLTIMQMGASGGRVVVLSVAAGVITGITLPNYSTGVGYSNAVGLATTGGTGTGATVTITAVFQTPVFATGGDISNYRYDNKSLASKVTEPEAWRVVGAGGQPAFGSGFSAPGGYCKFRKDGAGFVEINAVIQTGASNSNGVVFTLPAGYAPPLDIPFFSFGPNTSADANFAQVKTDGTVNVGLNGTGSAEDIELYIMFRNNA